jgi:hypothetical protein
MFFETCYKKIFCSTEAIKVSTDKAKLFIRTACVLHNFIIREKCNGDDVPLLSSNRTTD